MYCPEAYIIFFIRLQTPRWSTLQMVRVGGERKIAKTLKKQRMFKEGIQAGREGAKSKDKANFKSYWHFSNNRNISTNPKP